MNENNVVDTKSLELLNKAIEVISQSTEDEPIVIEVNQALLNCVNWFMTDMYKEDCAGPNVYDYNPGVFQIPIVYALLAWLDWDGTAFEEVKDGIIYILKMLIEKV